MAGVQVWLVTTMRGIKIVSPFMHAPYGWAACETLHFIGLSLLIGMIGTFDLRLLGVAKRVTFVIEPLNQTKAKLARHQ